MHVLPELQEKLGNTTVSRYNFTFLILLFVTLEKIALGEEDKKNCPTAIDRDLQACAATEINWIYDINTKKGYFKQLLTGNYKFCSMSLAFQNQLYMLLTSALSRRLFLAPLETGQIGKGCQLLKL